MLITRRPIEEELQKSYLDYSMSVIISRALPDVRDGLKPVHRRILYTMYDNGYLADRMHRKCARICGDVLGRLHPHGDNSCYDALVRLAQPWNMRAPLIDGQGNFGSIDGDRPAAMRYTEARLAPMANELLDDIDEDTVDFVANYDGSSKEPVVLPSRFPHLLLNGSAGIAVGMATNIPPHNLGEIIDAAVLLAKNPNVRIETLLARLPAPDFPTGGEILNPEEYRTVYETGKGSLVVRGRIDVERARRRNILVISEIPFQVRKGSLLEKLDQLVQSKKLDGISEVRDESNRDGLRIVLELRMGADADAITENIFKFTALQSNYSVNMLVLSNGRPETLGIKAMLTAFIDFRKEVIRRRTEHRLAAYRKSARIALAMMLMAQDRRKIIDLISKADDAAVALSALLEMRWSRDAIRPWVDVISPSEEKSYRLDQEQATAILDMRLARLTKQLTQEHKTKLDTLVANIEECCNILQDEAVRDRLLISEMHEVKRRYSTKRLTRIGMTSSVIGETAQ